MEVTTGAVAGIDAVDRLRFRRVADDRARRMRVHDVAVLAPRRRRASSASRIAITSYFADGSGDVM